MASGTVYGGYDTSAGYNAYRAVLDYATSETATTWTVTLTGKLQSGYGRDSGGNFANSLTIGTYTQSTSSSSYLETGSTITLSPTFSHTYNKGTSAVNCLIRAYSENDGTYTGWSGSSTASTTLSIPALASYTISYNANGGSGAPSSQTKYHGTAITLSSTTPTRTGYDFKGWSTSSTATSVTYAAGDQYTNNSSATLYAVWKAKTYTISYNANGGSGAPNSQTKTHGVSLTLSSTRPTRSGYSFLGWSTSSSATSATYQPGGTYPSSSNADATLYAVWQVITYTVSYRANYTGGTNPSSQTKTHGVALTLRSAITRASATSSITVSFDYNGSGTSSTSKTSTKTVSYTFAKWNTASDGSGTAYAAGASYTSNSDITLYARWTSSVSRSSVTLPSPSWTSHTFDGWYTSASGGTRVGGAGGSYAPTSDATVTLYAHWTQSTRTVTLDPQGGSVSSTKLTKVVGTALTLPTPTRSGCKFLGWNTSSTGGGTHYGTSEGGYTYDSGDRKLYAQWIGVNVSSFTVVRSNSSGTRQDDGTYAKATTKWSTTCTGSASDVTTTVTVKYRSGSSDVTAGSTTGASGTYSLTVGSGSTFATSTAYKFTVTVKATWSSYNGSSRSATATKVVTLRKVFRLLDALAGGTGLAVGTIAALANTFEVALPTIFNGVSASIRTSSLDRDGGNPSENTYGEAFRVTDVDGDAIGYAQGYKLTTGETGMRIVAFNTPAGGGDAIYNILRVGKLRDGTNVYGVTDSNAFRVGINAAGVESQADQNVNFSSGSGSVDFTIYSNVTNSSSSDYGDRVGLWAKPDGIALYNSTDQSYDWNLTLPVSVANGGTGRSDVYKTTTASSIITAASGFTIGTVNYAEWGKVAQLSVQVKGFAASTGSQTAGTVVSGKRPVYAVYATAITSSNAPYATLAADGELSVYWSSAPGTTTNYTIRFVYILA